MRDGIDDRGMELISHVNCTMAAYETPLEWRNAQWWQKKMWYGQVKDAKGVLKSFSKYLDIIAHELTHGVTETTAGLVYCNQSGALNESFSDIFGILIRNWDWANWRSYGVELGGWFRSGRAWTTSARHRKSYADGRPRSYGQIHFDHRG